jgi:hypothetical protein
MKCQICEVRKPRRYCPGVRGDICPQCCGNEREVTVNCPLDCEYLREGRLHERPPEAGADTPFPNQDVNVTEQFLRDQEPLVVFVCSQLLGASLATEGARDFDVRDALDSLIRTYRTLESGLIYETKPANLVALNIQTRLQEAIEALRKKLSEQGSTGIRDKEILGILIFAQRLELTHNNGRRRGRAFIDFLRSNFPGVQPSAGADPAPSLIQV